MANRMRLRSVIAFASVLALGASGVYAQSTGADARKAFAALKRLQGEWQGKALGPDKPPLTLTFKHAQRGSVVIETFAPGTSLEMMTIYHLDGNELVLTHYCATGNQPRMKMNRTRSKVAAKAGGEVVAFDYAGASNLRAAADTYMRSGTLHLVDANHLKTEWTTFRGGKLLDTNTVVFTRVK